MARRWPEVNKKTHPLRKNNLLIFITVSTEMFCGSYIEEHIEAPKKKEFSNKDNLHNKVDARARDHIKRCKECNGYYN